MFDLHPIRTHPWLAHLEHHAEIGSTNDRALELSATEDLPTPALVLADRQNAGRGRGTNRWWSADGALTFSLVLDPEQIAVPTQRWPQVSLTAAVAIVSALEPFAPSVRFGVKWPNDVHAEGRKISGILVEVPNHPGRVGRRIILGIGINVNNSWQSAPEELRAVGTALTDLTGTAHSMTDVLLGLLDELQTRLGQLSQSDARLVDAWQSLCVLRGRQVEVDLGQRIAAGACAGIDAEGALILDSPTGSERLWGGIVRAIR